MWIIHAQYFILSISYSKNIHASLHCIKGETYGTGQQYLTIYICHYIFLLRENDNGFNWKWYP